MSSATFLRLARLMRDKRDAGEPPYVLFLGTGASLSSGCSALSDIVKDMKDIVGSDDQAAFFDFLDHCALNERALLLGKHLRGSSPSSGYRHLAELAKAGRYPGASAASSMIENKGCHL